MKGLWQLTWLEIKIFVREPLGLFGTVGERCRRRRTLPPGLTAA